MTSRMNILSFERLLRGAVLGAILLLLAFWLVGAALYINAASADLDYLLGTVYFNGWTPGDVRAAAAAGGFEPSLGVWMWLAQEMVIMAAFSGAGLVLFFGKRDLFGVLLGLTFAIIGTSISGAMMAALARVWPASAYLAALLTALGPGLFMFMFYLLPDGRFTPGWLRWIGPALLVIFLLASQLEYLQVIERTPVWTFSTLGLLALISQVYRYVRVSGPREQQQMRWIMAGFSLFVGFIFVAEIAAPFLFEGPPSPDPAEVIGYNLLYWLLTLISILVVLAMAVAVLRYRLWDIDLIIRRTLIYSGVTALLAAVYFGLVVVTQAAFVTVTGQRSPFAVVISTLAIAALFTPVRQRVQGFIDRRFYRRHYDAQKTLERFGETMRNEIDIEGVEAALLSAVGETMQPRHAGLWLAAETHRRRPQ